MKKILLFGLLVIFTCSLFCQILDDINADDKTLDNQVVKVNYNKKDAKKALLASAIFPGAGQFYIDKKNISAYIYPVIEAGLWFFYFKNYAKGDDITSDYEKFADANYNRVKQKKAQNNLIAIDNNDIYSETLFRLDDTGTQHFYEDIAKYDKYVFGWNDWYDKYVQDADPTNLDAPIDVSWVCNGQGQTLVWLGNRPINNPDMTTYDKPYSETRAKYIKQRKDAEVYYSRSRDIGYFIMLNHMVSAVDAVRVTKKYNKGYLAQNKFQSGLRTAMFNNQLTPVFSVSMSF